MDMKGKVALVTGGAAGIGRAFCEELARHGAKVAICDINTEAGEQLAERIGKDRAIFCPCDVTDYPQYEESFQAAVSTFGGLDIVINNAGIMNDRFWELEVDVNLNGIIRGTLLALRFMGKDRGGRGGTVVNIGSNVCVTPYVSIPIYTATKHAIVGFSRSFGDSYHEKISGVRVIALCPGPTDTGLVGDVRKQLLSGEYEKAWIRDTAGQGPCQKPEHVGRALVTVLQKAASGTVWAVNNGEQPREIHFAVK